MSTSCLWNRGGQTVTVWVTRTEGDDIPAGHCEALIVHTGTTEFVPTAEIVPHHHATEVLNLKHSKETS